jgi:glycosyltransferase involved in cell wall biosynthesis
MSPTFTIFIPTYNRAYILPKALESIENQTFRDFEVLILDDGSTDNTKEVVQEWSARTGIPVRYYWHENRGTPRTWNRGAQLAHGKLFVYLDSDNRLVPTCLERILHHWNSIPPERRHEFAGVEGMCAYPDGRLEGVRFPTDVLDATHIEMRRKWKVRGDKYGAILTETLRRFPYPEIEGERHVRPSLTMKRIAHAGYKYRYVNDLMQIIDRQADGKTANRFLLRMRHPKGFRLYYQEDLNLHTEYLSFRERVRSASEYVRYSLHAGVGFRQQMRELDSKLTWLAGLPRGVLRWIADRMRMISRGHTQP